MRCAIHQPAFVPWLPFFYKMSMVDKFIILSHCQFSKNGYQNRYQNSDGKWITMPIIGGVSKIRDKEYTNGILLLEHNMQFIEWVANTLGLGTEICCDVYTESTSTQRLVDNLNAYGATTYVTNEAAKDKYLDEQMIYNAGMDIEYCKVPKHLNIPIFEALNRYGILGLRNQMYKRKAEDGEHKPVI